MPLISINPSIGKEIKSYPQFSEEKVNQIIIDSSKCQNHWKKTNLEFRLDCLKHLSEILNDKKREYASLMAEEMGKPLKQGKSEIEKCIFLCEYYVNNAALYLQDKIIDIEGQKSFVIIQPIGLILGVMPWNFPFWQVFRFSIPTLIAGNGALLKHASNVQGCGFAIESAFLDAGFPKNLFKNISISGSRVSSFIKNASISAVTITGSTPAGKSVAQVSGMELKKTVLELGGSDPYVILEDADIERSIQACIEGRILNTGQSCISAKRLIVVDSIYDNFLQGIKKSLMSKIMGDPNDDVDIGPMVSLEAREEVHEQVQKSIIQGATLLLGGFIPEIPGAFYPITLLSEVEPGMLAFDEEIFGPVFSIVRAKDENHAIKLANQTPFGLGAAVFTENISKGEEIARHRLNSGMCFVNDFVKSDPRLPFGGIRESGYGRELSIYGLMEFVNIKTVVINDKN
ncbi:MAG: succinate-semialdehyde dehydrogenase [Candidatus Marinimicrobia bacterium]|nr:succinate-semialdehyde dehydrogenase [Candidatus Neomarinimicrobiota bacterium]